MLSLMFQFLSSFLFTFVLLLDFVSGTLLQNIKAMGENFKTAGPETMDRLVKIISDVSEINTTLKDEVQQLIHESVLWREIAQTFVLAFYMLVALLLVISITCAVSTANSWCRSPRRVKNE